ADALRRCKMPVKKLFNYTGKASELKIQLAARIIAQDANLYGSIQIENPYALKSLNEYKKSIDELIKIVKNKDSKAFRRYFDKNKKYFGKYQDEAYRDSSILIDKLLELQNPDRRSGLSKKIFAKRTP
ncbi:MAG: prephenate dehydrogenase dimerization domain-containing protein, partial [Patescibacteria group bacterium]